MSSLNLIVEPQSERLLENMRDIPFSIHEHLLGKDTILRPKQKEAISAVSNVIFEGSRAVAMIMPTGTGKTVISAGMLDGLKMDERTGLNPKRTIFISDSVEGILQTKDKMKTYADIDVSAYYGEEKNLNGQVITTTYNSWQSENFPLDPETIDLVMLDEAHRAISSARIETLKKYRNAIWVFLTASPDYDEQRSVLNYAKLGFRMTPREAVVHKLISGFRNIVLNSDIKVDLDEIGVTNRGDYKKGNLSKAINTEARNRIGAEYLLFANHPDTGKPIRDISGIISCANISHAKDVTEQINALYEECYPGQAPEHGFVRTVYGDMSGEKDSREDLLKWHKEGKIGYLAYSDLLNQNYDDKKIGVCLNLRPSRSTVIVTQRGGRAERLDEEDPGKIAIIVDVYDQYEGKTKVRPLLYAQAIGEVLVITDDMKQRAIREKFERAKRNKSSLENSDDFKDIVQELEMRIVTSEESILQIISDSTEENIDPKTDANLTMNDIANLLELNSSVLVSRFNKINEEWDLYNKSEGNDIPPRFLLKKVKAKSGQISWSLHREDLDDFIKDRLGEYFIIGNIKTKDDLSIDEMSEELNVPPTTLTVIVRNLQMDWDQYRSNPIEFVVPEVSVKKVKGKGQPLSTISRSELEIFKQKYIPNFKTPEKTNDDLVLKDLTDLMGISHGTITRQVKDIQKAWELYELDNDKYPKPAIPIKMVRVGLKQPVFSISRNDWKDFHKAYFPEFFHRKKTDNDLIVSEVAQILNISVKVVKKQFDEIMLGWEKYQADKETNKAPPIRIDTVKSNQGRAVESIERKDVELFQQLYFPALSYPKKDQNYFDTQELGSLISFKEASIRRYFRQIKDEWESHNENPESIPQPKVNIAMVNNKDDRPVMSIYKDDVAEFFKTYIPDAYNLFLSQRIEVTDKAKNKTDLTVNNNFHME